MSWKAIGGMVLVVSAATLPATGLAASYAISANQISNFGMTFTAGSGSLLGFTFSNSASAMDTSGVSGVDMQDAPASCMSCGFSNQFFAHPTGSSAFSYGDALIANTTVTGGAGAASAIAESYTINGDGFAYGSNQLTSVSFTVAASSQIQFGFNANLIMNTWLTAGGQSALAESTMRITLSNSSGANVFDWAPGSLNWILGANDSHNVSGYFSNNTGTLAAGNYTLKISMSQTTNVSAVPVPAAAWLLGSGLLGLAGVARRKSH